VDLTPLLMRRDEFLAFLRHRLAVPADAEDVLQQAFLTAARSSRALRSETSVIPWFYQVLRTTLTDHLRAGARAARVVDDLGPSSAMPPFEGGSCACGVALLYELPDAYREILTLVDVREEPLENAARALGLTLNNTTVRLHRARKALRDRLEACCGCKSSRECQSCRCATAVV
jgi:RNA polymerase sigma-70 factor (ECF subfamily)